MEKRQRVFNYKYDKHRTSKINKKKHLVSFGIDSNHCICIEPFLEAKV